MPKFLYGAAVQGIQNFIFQTNELRDIVGASELVDGICTSAFDCFVETDGVSILRAAGNIKYLFATEDACKRAVLEFPKTVVEMAPGITISQAVVVVNDSDDFGKSIDALESKLRIQRNKPLRSPTVGFTGVLRSRRTGLPACENYKGEFVDKGSLKKKLSSDTCKLSAKAFGFDIPAKQVAFEIDKITGKNNWIAVIHADGNGLGQVVQKIGHDSQNFKTFSKALDEATKAAAVDAFNVLVEKKYFDPQKDLIPIRPIVLGGDDFTVVCRADFAIEYVRSFLKAFENRTGEGDLGEILKKGNVFKNGEGKLTACAGIAFVKSSYPFHFAYELAEALCGRAKKDAKVATDSSILAPSCLMFHKVQSSFVEDFESIAEKELRPCESHSYEFGPYYLDERTDRWTVDGLLRNAMLLDREDGNAIKSSIRQWMTLMSSDVSMAQQKANRLKSLLPDGELLYLASAAVDGCERKGIRVYPAYDLLSVHSVQIQNTRNVKEA